MSERTINLTVIGDRACSTTRTYLHHLREAGLRPRRLWLVDFHRAPRFARVARTLLGPGIGNRLHRTVRVARPAPTAGFAELCTQVQRAAGLPVLDHFSSFDPYRHAGEVDEFPADDFDDPYLHRRMQAACDTAFLYTNGGRVPAALLADPRVRVFHVHPGIVPDMRGSDCFLWSCAVRQRIGVSCFYMSAGIDEGQVIAQAEYDIPDLSGLRGWLTRSREDTAYRALLYAVDPHYRARLFAAVMAEHADKDLRDLPARPQDSPARPAYLWMHSRLRIALLRRIAA